MFKSIIIVTIYIVLFATTIGNAASISSVVCFPVCVFQVCTQTGKQIKIGHMPMIFAWSEVGLIKNGIKTNIRPSCFFNGGFSPITCNLASVPDCDTVRMVGNSGAAGGPSENQTVFYSFNCTIIA
ncbi:hypothetical protein DFA_10549 [Cavenderia fasciculata]|uniref:Carbohydrate binding domain-containing protein n=1 Tax=Cavenderia fasciculata TaxID=261658 RepID=F4QAI8_CACFS|nr:uncharacterized protein DFA_10549 [Cavenderia fasciculata]EGG15707.1 hypothetical protein DFA_10549 [Cavenderia fasciculata]|eukprot:XP_004354449.1 hypothetical protein DFA_10549 [Cavenderia fasciculata]